MFLVSFVCFCLFLFLSNLSSTKDIELTIVCCLLEKPDLLASVNYGSKKTKRLRVILHWLILSLFNLASTLEILDINQIDNNAIELFWINHEKIDSNIQIQYRLVHPKSPWMIDSQIYNQSTTQAVLSNLQSSQIYKFRLITLDGNGKPIILSSSKRFPLRLLNQPNLPVPQITDAWITNDGQISLKWKINESSTAMIDGFIIYYRLSHSQGNFTKITLPNLRLPMIDTYTITSIEGNEKYELRMATYSSRGLSAMSNSMEISVPSRKCCISLRERDLLINR